MEASAAGRLDGDEDDGGGGWIHRDSEDEVEEAEDDRRNMTGGFYHGRNRRYSGSYDNLYDESTIV